jgi:malate dehydrogenase
VAGKSAMSLIDTNWYAKEFIPTVQQRGAAIIEARGASSAASAANAAIDHMHDWALGSAAGDSISMSIYSDGSYGIEKGLIYSYPVVCKGGDWQIVQGRAINDFSRERMKATETELREERDAVAHLLPK